MTKDFWKTLGKCGTDSTPKSRALFFSDKRDEQAQAKRLCAVCPVVRQCRKAGEDEDYGIWGGITALERKALRRDERAV